MWTGWRGFGYVMLAPPFRINFSNLFSLQKKWIAIFQYPVVAFVCAIATDITQAAGIYCLDSNKPYFAHLWVCHTSHVPINSIN